MVAKTKLNRILGLSMALLLAACSGAPTEQPSGSAPTPAADPQGARWTITEGIETPESVYFDSASGSLFISQIAGMPMDRDGNGRIVKATPDGQVVAADWVTGLNAPKGLRSHEGTLWTADIDEVIGIDIASGMITTRVKVDGAQFLNDVACGADGTVYVSDMMLSRIYAVKDGKASVFADGPDLEHPNGLLIDDGRLVVAAWGKPEADFTTKVPGRIYALDLKTKAKTLITPNPAGNFDGLESDGSGGYLATDYMAGKLVHVTPGGDIHELRKFDPGTADLGIAKQLAIIPHMNENKIVAYDLSQ
jgi:sugar lactone lactonase YvrE